MSLFANDSRGACARRRGDCRHTLGTRARRALTSQRADALRAQHHVLHKRTNGARRRRKWAISVLAEHSRPEHARAISWPSVGVNGNIDSALHSHGGIQRLWRVGSKAWGGHGQSHDRWSTGTLAAEVGWATTRTRADTRHTICARSAAGHTRDRDVTSTGGAAAKAENGRGSDIQVGVGRTRAGGHAQRGPCVHTLERITGMALAARAHGARSASSVARCWLHSTDGAWCLPHAAQRAVRRRGMGHVRCDAGHGPRAVRPRGHGGVCACDRRYGEGYVWYKDTTNESLGHFFL